MAPRTSQRHGTRRCRPTKAPSLARSGRALHGSRVRSRNRASTPFFVSLRLVTVGIHTLLIGMLAASVLAQPTAPRLALTAILLLPLLLAFPGLWAGRRAIEQRLAVLLVAYIGGISVEVVAQSGGRPLLSAALLAAALELGLLLALTRRRAARE